MPETRIKESIAEDSNTGVTFFALGVLLGIAAGILAWIRLVHTWRDKA